MEARARRILFVDDEPAILSGLRRSLSSMRREWEMAFALGGEEALRELDKGDFDVVVSDMRMPGMDGASLLDRVRERSPGCLRLILSGQTSRSAALRAANSAHQFLNKPCDREQLIAAIRRAVRLRGVASAPEIRAVIGGVDALPHLPRVYQELSTILEDPETSLADVGRVIERDVGLSAKILSLSNSGFFGLPRRLASVREAVTYLGSETIRSIVLGMEVLRSFRNDEAISPSFVAHFERHALDVSQLARELVVEARHKEPARTAGLLHDIGRLLLAPRTLDGVRYLALDGGDIHGPRPEVERELLGFTHGEVGAHLLALWGLPEDIVEAVAWHHSPSRCVEEQAPVLAAVHAADAIVTSVRAPRRGDRRQLSELVDEGWLRSQHALRPVAEWSELLAGVGRLESRSAG